MGPSGSRSALGSLNCAASKRSIDHLSLCQHLGSVGTKLSQHGVGKSTELQLTLGDLGSNLFELDRDLGAPFFTAISRSICCAG